MTAIKSRLIVFSLIGLTACTTLSTRNKIFRDMALGAATGTLVAQTKLENREAYTSMYAGIGAATAGAISLLLNIPDEDKIQKENEQLKSQIIKYEKQLQPQLVQQGNSLFSSPIPKEVSALVEPGEWKRYKMDQWVQDVNQPNTWYRQIEMFEIIPPVAK